MNKQKSTTHAHLHPSIKRLLRHRWSMAVVGSTSLLGMVAAFALAPSGDENRVQTQAVLEQLNTPTTTLTSAESGIFLREERIERSDTISSLAVRLGIADPEALEFMHKDPATQSMSRQLRPGKIVSAKTGLRGDLVSLYFPISGKDAMLVVEKRGSAFVASEQVLRLETQTVVKAGEIRSSLFGATDTAGIPDAIATQMTEIFGGDMDFQRDLRKGDRFSLVYETLTHRGQPIRTGRILSAEFVNNQKVLSAFWFQTEGGKGAYYTADGQSLRKPFLRSPLEFSRVTSGFTNARLHPVLQTWRAHKGVDYGAPSGTPVRSVADGTVDSVGRQAGYGNLIVVKHQGNYSTAYGHLSGFAAGIRKGSRISQGETIAFVGQTGLATGPHLHYEFRVNNQQINPLAVTLPTSTPLESSQIASFKAATGIRQEQLELAKQITVAVIE